MKIVIVGAGEVGYHIAQRLALENKDVVVIDKDPAAIRRVSDNIDVQVVLGSGGSPAALEEAGIKQAEILLAVTNSDETNLVACLIAHIISPTTKKLARIRDGDFDAYHEQFRNNAPYIDTIINPEIEVVKAIERLMYLPGAIDVGEFADGKIKFISVQLDKTSALANVELMEIPGIVGKMRLLITAIEREDNLIIPRGDDRLLPGDIVYFICEEEHLSKIMEIFHKQHEPVKRVLIVGGGRVGFRLASQLVKNNIKTKIIEKDVDRCSDLADRLNRVVILHGDGSDQDLLNVENIRDMDVAITLTNDEKTNILTSLLCKRMGVKQNITKITQLSYFSLLMTIGMNQVVSTRLSAINSILQHVRKGKVLSAISIKGEDAEVMEAVAMETSDIVGKPLKNMSFPRGMLVTGIIRGETVIIPSGESIIHPNDRIIIFAKREAVSRIEKILSVKLEYF